MRRENLNEETRKHETRHKGEAHPVSKMRVEQVCIILKVIGYYWISPATQILQCLGKIPVVHCHLKWQILA